MLMFLSSGKDISVTSQKRFLGIEKTDKSKQYLPVILGKTHKLIFSRKVSFGHQGSGGGGLQLDALKISKKSIFDKTNF